MGEAQRGCISFLLDANIKFSKLQETHAMFNHVTSICAMLTEKPMGVPLKM